VLTSSKTPSSSRAASTSTSTPAATFHCARCGTAEIHNGGPGRCPTKDADVSKAAAKVLGGKAVAKSEDHKTFKEAVAKLVTEHKAAVLEGTVDPVTGKKL
jgi:hypothetical protein